MFAILSGLIGASAGNHNFSIVFIWIAWWAILILVAVPFFGRGWCGVYRFVSKFIEHRPGSQKAATWLER